MKKLLSFISAAVLSSCAVANSLLSASAVNFTLTITNQNQGGFVLQNFDNSSQAEMTASVWRDRRVGSTLTIHDNDGWDRMKCTVEWLDRNSDETKNVYAKLYYSAIHNETGEEFQGESMDLEPIALSADNPGPHTVHMADLNGRVKFIRVVIGTWDTRDTGGDPDDPDQDYTLTLQQNA
ncbi:MAG: hypothetical protein LBJ95_00300 [Oscillospiraceae bacterium]|jgi:hypothetical protein|nr:hypothetical protein [Oscillospiraceae bacterium]